jgi:hypothetical protein
VGLSPLGTAATSGLLYKPQMIDEGDCGAIGRMKIGRGNRTTRILPQSFGSWLISNASYLNYGSVYNLLSCIISCSCLQWSIN